MKSIIFLIAFSSIFVSVHAQKKIQVKIKFSKLYATYNFVQQLSDYYPDSEYKRIYNSSAFNTAENRELLKRFDTLRIYESLDLAEYPSGQKLPLSTANILQKNLISNNSIEEFKLHVVGIIPSSELLNLSEVLETFIPIYDRLIYEPNHILFEQKIERLREYVSRESLSKYFKEGLQFYGGIWDYSIPFEIAVIPSLNKNGFTATAFMNNAVSEVQLDFEEYDILFSVLMHEIYHIIYNEQPLGLKNQIAQWFNEDSSPNSQYAFLLLNEALATAVGNGYVFAQITGEIDAYDWYNNKYINQMAKEIFPLVDSYIKTEKQIDQDFVKEYISAYDAKYSEWINELDHLLTYRYILAEHNKEFDFFLNNYPRTNVSYMEEGISSASIQRMSEKPVTKIVVITKDNKLKLKLLKSQFLALSKVRFNVNKEFVRTVCLSDKTKLIVVNSLISNPELMLENAFKTGVVSMD